MSILDDGIEKNHPDLAANYVSLSVAERGGLERALNPRAGRGLAEAWWRLTRVPLCLQDPKASYDVNDGDPDPQPRYTQLNDNR